MHEFRHCWMKIANFFSIKTPILTFKVIQGHRIYGNQEPVYDFLLVINSNLGPISHRYWDTATYWLKITNFF